MRLSSLLPLALLPLLTFAAKSPSGDRFATYRTKQLSSPGSIKLDDSIYNALTKGPRDYNVAVLLTALDARFGCELCRNFQPEFELLGKSWLKGDKNGDSRLLFGTLDFADGKEIFQSLQLQTAPVLLFFPATAGPNASADAKVVRYDFSQGTDKADPIHTWISRQLPADAPNPPIVRPFPYFKFAAITTTVLGVITAATVAWPHVSPFIQNRNLWAGFSIIAILLFTGGHMYNHIRKVPYVGLDGKGKMHYFAPGFQNQVGMETQLVAAVYGLLAFATISLALKVPRMSDPRAQQLAVVVWAAVMYFTNSFLLSIFRVKNGGYPFWLPPF